MFPQSIDGPLETDQFRDLVLFKRGGMGEIYLADDSSNSGKVAIKLINIPDSSIEALVKTEIDLALKLQHKNIVKSYFTSKTQIAGQSYFYIVQRYYTDGNLRGKLQKNEKIENCLKMFSDLLAGIREAHKLIVHRDLKPENVLIDTNGSLVIADFGLSKYVEEQTRSRSFKGSGTLPYMAPEAWLGDKNTVSMDIYSLGIIFFEILAGALPIIATSESEWREYHLYKQLPDIGKFRQNVPVKVRQILSKMTAKPIGERYKSADEISTALAEAKNQFDQDEMAAEKLASVAHQTLETYKAEKLKAVQLAEKIADYKKILNYHITTVFEKVKEIVASVNARLEDKKIVVEEKQFNGDLRKRTLRLSFGQIALLLDFCDYNTIEEYECQQIEQAKSRAIEQYGRIRLAMPPSFFKTRNVVFFGKVETNYARSPIEGCYGFNLVLVRPEGELYGQWWMAKFADSSFNRNTQRKNVGLDEPYFLKEFELCLAMHVMSVEFRELTDQDLVNAIEEILKR